MRIVVTRVKQAHVDVDGRTIGAIDHGLLVLVGVRDSDTAETVEAAARKLVNLRIFNNEDGKFDRSLMDVGGSALVVSQFTLLGTTRTGNRPDFSGAARPDVARPLYEQLASAITRHGVHVETGQFGATMDVSSINDGPVTIVIDL